MSEPEQDSSPVTLLDRFNGNSGHQLLMEVLSGSVLLRGIPDVEGFLAGCEISEVPLGKHLIEQAAADNCLYIVLSGSFHIQVNGREVATRNVGDHIGEMALIDPTARRSATAIAAEDSLVLRCPEPHFSTFADANPKLWRRVAVQLSRRLIERNKRIRPPRAEPVLFIGCSKEALETAREIQAGLDYDRVVVEIWTDGVFNTSKTPIEDLTNAVTRIDFGALLLTPDDRWSTREADVFGPRDNVVFELGLIIGAIGRCRTFILVPRGVDLKLPSDLLGVKPIDYPTGQPSTVKARLGPACTEIRKLVNRLGPL